MTAFSGAVTISDLNDFISPSQACVVNLEGNKLQAQNEDLGQVQLQPSSKSFLQTTTPQSNGPVKVSLHDCLACSGCVTSAETVLLQHQSADEFASKLADPAVTVVVSLSPQSIVSLASFHQINPAECAAKITAALKIKGVVAVFDISWSRDVSLLESASEFIQRYKSTRLNNTSSISNNHHHSHNSNNTSNNSDRSAVRTDVTSSSPPPPLPVLASACPGWVCYAEKTHGSFILPYISSTKSPQAVLGTLIKKHWARSVPITPGSIYHCAVMPCFDKKLEAARDDFKMVDDGHGVNGIDPMAIDDTSQIKEEEDGISETDCVLATIELHEWLEAQNIDLKTMDITLLPPSMLGMDVPFTNQVPQGQGQLYSVYGGSGGYLEYIFRRAAKELYNQTLPPGPLPLIQGRNSDFKEISLVVDNKTVLRFAAAYGFRNIQGLVRKIKLQKCDYDYIEVMACPSGCLNGGGQAKPREKQSVQELIEELEFSYNQRLVEERFPESNKSVEELYRVWVKGEPGSLEAKEMFHTQYHKREKTITASLADW